MPRERQDTNPLGSAFRPGIVVGEKFTLLRLIAEGGYGAVYEAVDNLLQRHVAVKLLHPDVAAMTEIVARFLREAQALAKIDHPNVVAVHEMGRRRDGSYYMVQELLSGGNLREHLKEKQRLSPQEAVDVLDPIMSALISAHQAHIVHRDIKPENVVLARTTTGAVLPKLVDFGIAKLPRFASSGAATVVGHIFGTPAYMAPEQVIGSAKVDARADVWAMGIVFFELLSGKCPFEGEEADVLESVRSQPIPPLQERQPDVPPELAHAIHKALERKPERRPTMQALREEILAALQAHKSRPARAPSPARAAPSPARPAPRPAAPAQKPAPQASAPALDVAKPIITSTDSVIFFDSPLAAEPIEPDEPDADELPLASTDFSRISDAPTRPRLVDEGRASTRPDMGWTDDLPLPESPAARKLVLDAEQALSVNALEDAIAYAERAIQKAHGASEVAGRARLALAIACSWLGGHADAQRAAADAMQSFKPGSSPWYTAIGHLALADGQLGSRKGLMTIVSTLRSIEATGPVTDAHIVAACRLFVSLVRVGSLDVANKLYEGTLQPAAKQASSEPFARGWLAVAGAELAAHSGDPMTYLHYVTQSVSTFTDAGDVRGASLQRVNLGNAYVQLGCYAQAEALMRDALRTAEPMGLGFLGPLKANLGFALARLGRLDEAAAMETAALKQCDRTENKRFSGVARIYLSAILGQKKELARAVALGNEAIAASGDFPAIQAYAQAVLAGLLLEQGKAAEAAGVAASAMAALERLSGAEEGEALIRLTHAEALRAIKKRAEARAALGEASKRLLARADRIRDARFRQSFLDNIPENSRTRSLWERWSKEP